jgi:hypothetical protein
MRWKLLVVFGGIVVAVGLLCWVLLAAVVGDATATSGLRKQQLGHALEAGNSRVGYEALQSREWLAYRATAAPIAEVFGRGTEQARRDAATAESNHIRDAAVADPAFALRPPAVVMFVDAQGVVLGRNGSALGRGDVIAEVHPVVRAVLADGRSRSDVWLDPGRQEQLLISCAAINGADGQRVGALVMGASLNDEWLDRVSDATSGLVLAVAAAPDGKVMQVAARSAHAPEFLSSTSTLDAARRAVEAAVLQKRAAVAESGASRAMVAASPLLGSSPELPVVLVAMLDAAPQWNARSLLWPIMVALAVGLMLVAGAAWLLGNYVTQPVAMLEDGLLAVLSGDTALRFEFDHAEFGGLATRINSLLNTMTGTPEDTTDEMGRPSTGPTAQDFRGALEVEGDGHQAETVSPEETARLAAETETDYRRRLYGEYIEARRRAGMPTDTIDLAAFTERSQGLEQSVAQRTSGRIRLKVIAEPGQAVRLVAVRL